MKIKTQQDVIDYYAGRGISPATLQRFGVEPGADGHSIRLREGVDGCVFRTFKDDAQRWSAGRGPRQPTIIRSTATPERVYVVEGLHDLMSLVECGITDAVALPSVASVKALSQVIRSNWESGTVCLLLDNDQAGDTATAEALKQATLFFSQFALTDFRQALNGAKDVNAALQRDRTRLAASLHQTHEDPPEWVTDAPPIGEPAQIPTQHTAQPSAFCDHLAALVDYYCSDAQQPPRLMTGLKAFDDCLRIAAGHLVLIAARPAMGKTALGFQVALHAADTMRVVYVSLEMSARELALRAVLGSCETLDRQDFTDPPIPTEKRPTLKSACAALSGKNLEILDDANLKTIEKLEATLREHAKVSPIGLVVVDYVQLMGGGNNGGTRERDIAEISRGLKLLARELECPVIALAQLNRGVEQRQDKRPFLSDLRESGSLEQDADAVVFLYRDEYYNPESLDAGLAEIIIAKNRHGPTQTTKAQFNARATTFGDFRIKTTTTNAPGGKRKHTGIPF